MVAGRFVAGLDENAVGQCIAPERHEAGSSEIAAT